MEFIEAMLNPNFLLKICSKEVWGKSPEEWKKSHLKGKKSGRASAWHGRHGGAKQHGLARGGRATSLPCRAAPAYHPACFLPRVHRRAAVSHARALPCFPLLFYSWCLGLPRTSNLPWNRSWNLPFYRNLMISSEMKNQRILGIIRSKGR